MLDSKVALVLGEMNVIQVNHLHCKGKPTTAQGDRDTLLHASGDPKLLGAARGPPHTCWMKSIRPGMKRLLKFMDDQSLILLGYQSMLFLNKPSFLSNRCSKNVFILPEWIYFHHNKISWSCFCQIEALSVCSDNCRDMVSRMGT